MKIKYSDFYNLKYVPKSSDLICLFRVTPGKNFTFKESASRVASESSNGTWTDLEVPERITKLSAKAYEVNDDFVKIAYPVELFERGSMPQILSSIAGNVFGMKAVKGLRIEDVKWPKEIIKSFKGPLHGMKGVRKILGVNKRPLTATVPKPKVGYTAREHADVGLKAWTGGLDLLKDDENLTSQRFNKVEERIKLCMKAREKAEKETGECKGYLFNVTAETKEMIRRTRLAHEMGNEFVMIDVLTAGWSAVQTLRDECHDLGLAIHAHRAFHAAFDKNPYHGMDMKVLAEICRIIGVDSLHIGGLGKLVGGKQQVKNNYVKASELSNKKIPKEMLEQKWTGTKPLFSTCSGGLHPGIIARLFDLIGTDIIIQAGGGVSGHPGGITKGAVALRQAINAYLEGKTVKEYAENHSELKQALNKWGSMTPE